VQPRSGCAINATGEALGDHWSVPLLRNIIFGDRRYFCELLVRDDAARGQRVRYSLTEAGIEPLPIIYALGNWGLDWRTGKPHLRARQKLMRQQGHAFVEELMDKLRTRHLDQPRPHDDPPLPSERLQAAYSAAARRRDRRVNNTTYGSDPASYRREAPREGPTCHRICRRWRLLTLVEMWASGDGRKSGHSRVFHCDAFSARAEGSVSMPVFFSR
jgi:DNA-binding HxlR family transcriptional regulator